MLPPLVEALELLYVDLELGLLELELVLELGLFVLELVLLEPELAFELEVEPELTFVVEVLLETVVVYSASAFLR
ncbi:hypothetical protein ACF09G_37700, partial [Streptomyces albogriseolus]|uniref:hypothetical protein n=1 Tax=Streptomyces albogriseolus TaxID=1887 RepID=UPI0036FAA93E